MNRFKRYCAAALTGLMMFSAAPGVLAAEKTLVTDACDNFENPAVEKFNNTEAVEVPVKWASDVISEGDTMWRKIDPATITDNPDKPSYVIFHTEEAMAGFHVETFFCKRSGKLAKDISFQASSDGQVYAGVPGTSVERTVPVVEVDGQTFSEDGWADYLWRQVNFDCLELPADTHYLKVQFGNTNDVKYYDVAISKVEISAISGSDTRELQQAVNDAKALLEAEKDNIGNGDGQYPRAAYDALQDACDDAEAVLGQEPEAEQGTVDSAKDALLGAIEAFRQSRIPLALLIDDCEDFGKAVSHTNLKPVTSNVNLSDNTRFARVADGAAEVVYQVEEDIQFIEVEAAYTRNDAEVKAGTIAGDMKIQVSQDETGFTDVQAVRSRDGVYLETWEASKWYRVRFSAFDVPAGTRYVKIIFGDQTAEGANWANQLMKVTLDNEKHGSSISGMSVWEVVDGSGVRVDAARLKEGGKFKITGNLTIDPTAAESALLVAAVMDGDRLCSASLHRTSDSGRFDFADESVVVPAGLEQPNIRVFMWDGGTKIQPLAAAQDLF